MHVQAPRTNGLHIVNDADGGNRRVWLGQQACTIEVSMKQHENGGRHVRFI
jgi:hypothetical protein